MQKRIFFLTLLFLFWGLWQLQANKAEPLHGEMFSENLTVPQELFPSGQPLTIDEATRLALADSLGIQIARIESRIQTFENPIAESIYDTHLNMDATYSHDRAERASIILGSRVIEGEVGVSLEKKIPLGTEIKIEGGTLRRSDDTAFSTLNRNYQSRLGFSVKQPLLRNFFGYVDRQTIRRVKMDTRQFTYGKLDEIEAHLYGARRAYWELVFAHKNYEAKLKALRKAQDFFRVTREQLETGLSEKPDFYAAEANVRRRVIEAREALTEVYRASNDLRVLLQRMEVSVIQPGSSPFSSPASVSYEAALSEAFEKRFDLKQAQLEIEKQDVGLKIAKNNFLPDLTFEGEATSTSLDRDQANSQGEVFSRNHPQFFAALRFSSPLEMRAERSEHQQAKLHLEKSRKRLRQLRMEIERDVSNAYQTLQFSAHKVRQAEKVRELEAQKLSEEEKNFKLGRSDSKTIIDFQEDVIEAEVFSIRAKTDYQIALDDFYRSQNRLLEKAGVTDQESLKFPRQEQDGLR